MDRAGPGRAGAGRAREGGAGTGSDQYHEPPGELSEATRTFARMCVNLTEEAQAIGWYEQRLDLERDETARAVVLDSLGEKYRHFCMELEFLLRRKPRCRPVRGPGSTRRPGRAWNRRSPPVASSTSPVRWAGPTRPRPWAAPGP